MSTVPKTTIFVLLLQSDNIISPLKTLLHNITVDLHK